RNSHLYRPWYRHRDLKARFQYHIAYWDRSPLPALFLDKKVETRFEYHPAHLQNPIPLYHQLIFRSFCDLTWKGFVPPVRPTAFCQPTWYEVEDNQNRFETYWLQLKCDIRAA